MKPIAMVIEEQVVGQCIHCFMRVAGLRIGWHCQLQGNAFGFGERCESDDWQRCPFNDQSPFKEIPLAFPILLAKEGEWAQVKVSVATQFRPAWETITEHRITGPFWFLSLKGTDGALGVP